MANRKSPWDHIEGEHNSILLRLKRHCVMHYRCGEENEASSFDIYGRFLMPDHVNNV